MIQFLVTIMMVLIVVILLIATLCACIVGLACLDYALDSDMKGALVKKLGPRPFLKKLRIKLIEYTKKFDSPTIEELNYVSDKVDPNTAYNPKKNPFYSNPDIEIKELTDQINSYHEDNTVH